MKKKWLIALLSGFCALTAVGFSACGGGGDHTHAYTDAVTAPTCTEDGYTTHTCECGDSYVDTYVDELGHDFTTYVSNGDGTETS
ncbi:MAG: hypothetical protein IJX18_02745, partial [Clostridia bacterium]|nr:hypothetical protein [Clostridia bacterium]